MPVVGFSPGKVPWIMPLCGQRSTDFRTEHHPKDQSLQRPVLATGLGVLPELGEVESVFHEERRTFGDIQTVLHLCPGQGHPVPVVGFSPGKVPSPVGRGDVATDGGGRRGGGDDGKGPVKSR